MKVAYALGWFRCLDQFPKDDSVRRIGKGSAVMRLENGVTEVETHFFRARLLLVFNALTWRLPLRGREGGVSGILGREAWGPSSYSVVFEKCSNGQSQ